MIKRHIASVALAASLFGGAAMGTVAAQGQDGRQAAGAAGVVAAVVQVIANLDNTTIEVVTVDIGNSLNNLTALNNILNNNDVDIVVQDISVLSPADIEILEEANIVLDDVVGVAILSGGDFIVFTR
jgi:hypothetical protein